MIGSERLNQNIKYFLLGAILAFGVILLTAASTDRQQQLVDNGRYQISAWGEGNSFGAFVLDTVTGKTKIVYQFRDLENKKFQEKNNLDRPFSTMD